MATITTAPKHGNCTTCASDEWRDESILSDGVTVGGTYWACARDGWASWGPAGLLMPFASRAEAVAAQVAAIEAVGS